MPQPVPTAIRGVKEKKILDGLASIGHGPAMTDEPKVQARLPAELRRQLKRACADADKTIQQAIVEAIRLWIAARRNA
jgi:hypothetical protein